MQVFLEDLVDQYFIIVDVVDSDFAEAVQQNEEIELVSCTVVDPLVGAERVDQVLFQFWYGPVEMFEFIGL